jgi:hypothetical protein
MLPSWNSQLTCIETFIQNRPIYLQIAEEHEDDLEERIIRHVNNSHLYKEAKNLLAQLKPISEGLNKVC